MKIKLFFFFLFTGTLIFADPSLCDCDSCVYIRRPDKCNTCPPPPPSTCAYNAPVSTGIGCMWKAALGASFVYFQAKQDNMQLALKPKSITDTSVNSNVIDTNWEYNTGYKVKGIFYLMHDSWDLTAGYFNFHNSYSTSASAYDQLPMIPYFYDATASNLELDSLTSRWKLQIDLITGEIGRKYYVGRNLFIRTFFGGEGGWIDQKLTIDYNTTQTGSLITIPYESNSCNWCAGPRIGMQTEWETSCFFRFIADGSISILYTEYNNKYLNQTLEGSTPDILTNEVRFNTMCFLRPHLSMLLGISWGNYVHCNSWFFDVLVGYQADVFFDQNPFGKPDNSLYTFTNDNLYLHGLVISATVEF